MTDAKPFLKWTGGKAKLLPELLARAPKEFKTYREPFLGGGSLFLALKPERSVLSDSCLDLIVTWQAVRDDPESVMESVDSLLSKHVMSPYGTFEKARAIDPATLNSYRRAARFLYLNKTCFNGLYRVNSNGQFNVPIGTNGKKEHPVVYDRENIIAVSKLLGNISTTIRHGDYHVECQLAQEDDFVYLDPPYAPLSATSNFTSYSKEKFNEAEQVRLRDIALRMKQRGVKVLLSNSSAPLILDLYSGPDWKVDLVDVTRTNGAKTKSRGVVKEVLIS